MTPTTCGLAYLVTCVLAAVWYRRGDPRCGCFYESLFWPWWLIWWLLTLGDRAISRVANFKTNKTEKR